jgi:hypothetical protein
MKRTGFTSSWISGMQAETRDDEYDADNLLIQWE